MVLVDARSYSCEELTMGLETRRIKAAIDDDRQGTSPRDLIYLYNRNASFPLQIHVVAILCSCCKHGLLVCCKMWRRELQKC